MGLGEFLSARRARITPSSVGLRGGGRRRVPGLRREELALLAGISAEYYQRLEQGRAANPSDEVLAAIARVLRLDAVEGEHLARLARPRREPAPVRVTQARPQLLRLLGTMRTPAVVISDRFDVLAMNPEAEGLFGAVGDNLARFLFLTGRGRDFYVEWDEVADATAAQLRAVAARHPGDTELAGLLRELMVDAAFRERWERGDVVVRSHGAKSVRHPRLGVLTLDYENFEVAGDSRQRLVAFMPTGSATEATGAGR